MSIHEVNVETKCVEHKPRGFEVEFLITLGDIEFNITYSLSDSDDIPETVTEAEIAARRKLHKHLQALVRILDDTP